MTTTMVLPTMKRFGIRPDYRPNLAPAGQQGGECTYHWNASRIQRSGLYQYHVYLWCRQLLLARRLQSVLDVGCGPATKLRELIAPVRDDLTLVDQPALGEIVGQTLPLARFTSLDLETCDRDLGRKFDLVICADVVEHLRDPDACLDFLRRHLSPRGVAVISTPERVVTRGATCLESGNPDHVREWAAAEFRDYLSARGLRILEQRFLPPRRIPRAEYLFSRLIAPAARLARWSGCQAVACSIPGNE